MYKKHKMLDKENKLKFYGFVWFTSFLAFMAFVHGKREGPLKIQTGRCGGVEVKTVEFWLYLGICLDRI